jgi:hypothetical protein
LLVCTVSIPDADGCLFLADAVNALLILIGTAVNAEWPLHIDNAAAMVADSFIAWLALQCSDTRWRGWWPIWINDMFTNTILAGQALWTLFFAGAVNIGWMWCADTLDAEALPLGTQGVALNNGSVEAAPINTFAVTPLAAFRDDDTGVTIITLCALQARAILRIAADLYTFVDNVDHAFWTIGRRQGRHGDTGGVAAVP